MDHGRGCLGDGGMKAASIPVGGTPGSTGSLVLDPAPRGASSFVSHSHQSLPSLPSKKEAGGGISNEWEKHRNQKKDMTLAGDEPDQVTRRVLRGCVLQFCQFCLISALSTLAGARQQSNHAPDQRRKTGGCADASY